MSADALRALLGQLNALPGVEGSLVCDGRGAVVADAFPARIDPSAPVLAAQLLADCAAGLAAVGGPVTSLSLRFGRARLLSRPVGAGHLLVLCAPNVNTQSLSHLTTATAPALERLLATPAPLPPRPPEPSQLYQVVQRIEAVIARKRLDPFRTRGAISLAAGFGLRAIDADTPDDPQMRSKLEAAAQVVLGEKP